jgi:hypothetical protein
VAGLCAASLAPGTAEVRLHLPPPLETELTPKMAADGLVDGRIDFLTPTAVRIASAKPVADLSMRIPPPPGLADAIAAARRFRGYPVGDFRGCFVCGPDRAEGDGMRLCAGPLDIVFEHNTRVAAPWTPDASLLRDGGIGAEFVWAALDCPGFFACHGDDRPKLLGQLTATITELPELGRTYIVTGWNIASQGRKHEAGTALHTLNGQLLACARAIWIEPERSDR